MGLVGQSGHGSEQKFQIGPGQASAFMIIDNLTNLLNDDWGY